MYIIKMFKKLINKNKRPDIKTTKLSKCREGGIYKRGGEKNKKIPWCR
jgi:hypothetical protein